MAWTDDTDTNSKYIRAKKLIKLLEKLPKGSLVATTRVGNLSVHDASLEQLGYIDIGSEKLEL